VPDGVLVIDKPAGMTSHDVVDHVRRRLRTKKVGHGGTLDPDATGILVIGVGRATRLLTYGQSAPKRYTAVARFGSTTTTQDARGDVLEIKDVAINERDVSGALRKFIGTIDQVPPMVSAVKIGGERLYKKARRGEDVDRPSRPVTIFDASVLAFDHPEATLDIRCSAGTYIRTLVHDLGLALGCGAHLRALRRTEAGGHGLGDTITLDAVNANTLRPVADAVAGLSRVEVDHDRARLVRDGRPLENFELDAAAPEPVAVMHNGELIAVYRVDGVSLVAERVLPPAPKVAP
jgi:tRNA pseudouridine55 synthase